MKKLATLRRVDAGNIVMGFRCRQPPPPPEKARTIRDKLPAKKPRANDGKQVQHNGKSSRGMMASSRNETANNRSMVVAAAKAASTTKPLPPKRNPQAWPSTRGFFTLFQQTLTNPCPSLINRKKNLQPLAY